MIQKSLDQPNDPQILQRRRLLLIGGAGTLGGIATYLGWPTETPELANKKVIQPAQPKADSPELPQKLAAVPTRDAFAKHVGTEFTLKTENGTQAICKLVAVTPATLLKSPKETFTAFSLQFEAKPDFLNTGGAICRLTHANLEPIDVYLCPVGKPEKKTVRLEAAFTQRA
jgi:hypothetical protein